MALILSGGICLTDVPKDKIISGKKGKYANLTITINDEPDKFGKNASKTLAQTKEEREAKSPRVYLGNCKLVWTNDVMPKVPPRDGAPMQSSAPQSSSNDDLPF